MATALSPGLASIRNDLAAASTRVHRLADPLDDDAWRRRPVAERWSVAECIEHLNMSSREIIPLLRAGLQDARQRGWTRPSHRLDVLGWFLSRTLEPPPRNRFKTPEQFTPPSIEPKDAVLREWDTLQHHLDTILNDANGVALTKVRITSPFNARIRYNAYSALRITAAHQRRHLWQAETTAAAVANAPN
jgi:hypothetical protein